MGKTIRVAILWEESEEFLELEPSALHAGAFLTTVEFWPEDGLEIEYSAKCLSNESFAGGGRVLKLLYDRKLNPKLKNHADQVAWGTTTLTLSAAKASATFDAVEPEWSGPADRCELLSTALFSSRKRNLVQVIQRVGQQRLRTKLLGLSKMPRCAITGETIQRVLDAAHIIDDARDGVAEPHNGLLLRADLHRLFDARPKKPGRTGERDYFTIDATGCVHFSRSLQAHEVYSKYHDKVLADRGARRRVLRSLEEAEKLYSQTRP